MGYLLDTNVVSALRQPQRAPATLLEWAANHPVSTLFLSVITILEIDLGVQRVARRDRHQAQRFTEWLDHLVQGAAGRILPVDTAVARTAAGLHVPDPAPFADALIAATALVHDLTLVTRNVRDFDFPDLQLIDPCG